MSNTPKAPGPSDSGKADHLSFEDALKKLEAIVDAMEAEDLPLESLLSKYAEGTQLARACQEKLADAEVKIRKLEQNSAGELKLTSIPPGHSEVE